MQKQLSAITPISAKRRSEVQLNESFRQSKVISPLLLTSDKQGSNKIFVQTPKALFISLAQQKFQKKEQQHEQQQGQQQQSQFLDNTQNSISTFVQENPPFRKQNQEVSNLSQCIRDKNQNKPSNVIKSKASIAFRKQRILQFFFHQNFIVSKGLRKVIVYNSLSKTLVKVPVNCDEFVLTQFPPYVFNCITGQYLNLYSEESVQKYGQIQRKRQNFLKKQKILEANYDYRKLQSKSEGWEKSVSDEAQKHGIKVVVIKISKLEVQCICKYGQTYYMGGYNRSALPGGRRSQRREIYLLQSLDPKINNKPYQIIKIDPNNFPISELHIQMPHLIAYCKPTFYIFNLKSHELLLKFQKQLKISRLLEGRFASNTINGVGISNRNIKSSIFTYDVENSPIYGVEITEHKQQATCLCLEKTGRIFGCHKSALFEYIPNKRITRCVKLYSELDTILWIESTPSNNLLVLRQSQKLQYFIEAFSIDQTSINDY